jgi:excisionase family DNA binding protein
VYPVLHYPRRNSMAVFGRLRSLRGMNGREAIGASAGRSTLTEGPLLCPDEAAELLSVKPSWVYEAARAHRIPCLRVGRHIRFTRAMLEQWLAEQVDG